MGTCESIGCVSSKYKKAPSKTNIRIVQRPSNLDLDSSIDDFETKLEQSNLLAKKVDNKLAEIGVHFVNAELIMRLGRDHKQTAIKTSRLDKWQQMISFGLESESASKVFLREPTKDHLQSIQFSSYAIVGLKNFYRVYPEKFRDRLKKGPPPAYRWLAWRFMGERILSKSKGRY